MSLDNLDNRTPASLQSSPGRHAYLALYIIYRTLSAVGQKVRCRMPSGRRSSGDNNITSYYLLFAATPTYKTKRDWRISAVLCLRDPRSCRMYSAALCYATVV